MPLNVTHWAFKCKRNGIQWFVLSWRRLRTSITGSRWDATEPSTSSDPCLAVNMGLTLGGQTGSWLRSSLRKGPRSSQRVQVQQQQETHQCENINVKQRERRVWKNAPVRAGCSWPEHHRDRGRRENKQKAFPLVLLLTSSQRNALSRQI